MSLGVGIEFDIGSVDSFRTYQHALYVLELCDASKKVLNIYSQILLE